MKIQQPVLRSSDGFALVITLSLMILLTVVAVGLLSLSAVSLRSTSQSQAQSEAKANARLALMIAIGELQKQMGPDQRISANSAIVSTETVPNSNWTGVWDSWVAGAQGSAPVNANYPSAYNSAHQTIGSQADPRMKPNYELKPRHFRSWLLSLDPGVDTNIYAPMGDILQGKNMPQPADVAVKLVAEGSLGTGSDPKDYVSASLLPLKAPTGNTPAGRYAWWVGDESQKARIMDDSYLTKAPANMAEKIFRTQAPASTGTSTIKGLENLTNDGQLATLPSLASLDLVSGATGRPAIENFHHVTPYSYSVLADVREGGLKRDLSAILERPIDPAEVYNLNWISPGGTDASFQRSTAYKTGGEAFMLYEFDSMLNSTVGSTGQAAVPIQDLAAYYQLYDHYRPGWKGGIQYSSNDSSPSNNLLNNGIMVSNPDYGGTMSDFEKYQRQYTAPYRNVVPVKLEVVLSYVVEKRTDAEIAEAVAYNYEADPANPDPYVLKIGVNPSITFWNPNNVPLIMNKGNPEHSSLFMRHGAMPLELRFTKSGSSTPFTAQMNRITNTQQGELFTLFVSGDSEAKFEPGECKVFSLPHTSQSTSNAGFDIDFYLRGTGSRYSEQFVPSLELVPGWDMNKFVRPTERDGRRAYNIKKQVTVQKKNSSGVLVFKPDGTPEMTTLDVPLTFKTSDSVSAEIVGGTQSDLALGCAQKSRHGRNQPGVQWHFRSYDMSTRIGNDSAFKNNFVYKGFPKTGRGGGGIDGTNQPIPLPPRDGFGLEKIMGSVNDPTDDLPSSFLYYSIKAGTETHESSSTQGSGRRFPTRPFLHSTPIQPPFFDSLDGASLYNYGWSWFFMPLNNGAGAPISISTNNSGYFGGGHTALNGTSHIVQQQLPLAPPISIAALSNARLGGYSLATEPPVAGYLGLVNPAATEALRRVTALGFAGLAPATSQAIGNSYAHPNIPAGKAFTTWNRTFSQGSTSAMPFADHSYLANKALWDDYFFSSITPQPNAVKMFENQARTAKKVAEDFFFAEKPLPNRRMGAYTSGLDQTKLDNLFTQSSTFTNGLADRIAAHLMVEGSFNINSTSVDAWKALFSSLKGKPVAYLDKATSLAPGGVNLKQDQPDGVPVASGDVPNAESYAGSSSKPGDKEQWFGWRELTDGEIEELAKAMVKQVKKRGPFLSLSEFVNRRLDSADPELSVKGALQAAIDDPDIPTAQAINGGFRAAKRKFTTAEKTYVNAVFPEAMDGAIAYGSPAYVDQADILRNMAEQITPRGDTFVIRTYGDSMDASGKVVARAWCEAVVQRIPDYVDSKDEPHLKQAALTSEQNKKFGRKLNIVGFRWLGASEI